MFFKKNQSKITGPRILNIIKIHLSYFEWVPKMVYSSATEGQIMAEALGYEAENNAFDSPTNNVHVVPAIGDGTLEFIDCSRVS